MTDDVGIFAPLIGWDGAKAILRSAIRNGGVHVLLEGPPASGKSVVLEDCIKQHVPGASYHDAKGFTERELRDAFANDPGLLLLDEIDAMHTNAYDAMSVPMEQGIVTKDTMRESYSVEVDVQVVAACNDADDLPSHIQSRFRTITFPEYDLDEYLAVCERLLQSATDWITSDETAHSVAQAVYEETDSKDPRDARDVAKLVSTVEEATAMARALTDPQADVESDPIRPDELAEDDEQFEVEVDPEEDDGLAFGEWIQQACLHAEPSRESDLFQAGRFLCDDCAEKYGVSADTPVTQAT